MHLGTTATQQNLADHAKLQSGVKVYKSGQWFADLVTVEFQASSEIKIS